MPNTSPLPKNVSVTMTLYQALEEAFNGHKIKRQAWAELPGGDEAFCCVRYQKLMIFKPESSQYADWIISIEDMEGIDWVVFQ